MSKHKTEARRDKAWRKKQADKTLIRLSKERQELWQLECDAPLVKLDEPYQRGWVRYFTLTEEASRRKDAEHFQKLLKYVQCSQRSRHPQFMERIHWKSKHYRPRRHNLHVLRVSTVLSLKIPENLLPYLMTQKRRPISTLLRLRELHTSGYRGQIKVLHPHYFMRITEPYMITHLRVALPDVDRRLAEIESILCQAPNQGRLNNLQQSRPSSWRIFHENRERCWLKREAMKETQPALLEHNMEKTSITQERVLSPPSLLLFFVTPHTHRRYTGSAA